MNEVTDVTDGIKVDPIWLKNYNLEIPYEIDPDQFSSLVHMFETRCSEYSERIVLSNMGKKLTYAELDELSLRFATWLQQELKIKPGDRVALMMPNLLQHPIAMFGILRIGGVVVNVNPMYSPRELEHQLNDSGAKAILILENFAHTLEKIRDKVKLEHIIITSIGDLLRFPKSKVVNFMVKKVKRMVPKWKLPGHHRFLSCFNKAKQLKFEPVEIDNNAIAFLQYTGGTTGVSKGVVLTHRNMQANILQSTAWVNPHSQFEKGKDVKMVTALPLYHIFALETGFFLPFNLGAESVLITNPRDFRSFINTIKDIGFNKIIGVNTLFNAMLNTKGIEEVDFSNLTCTVGGGMAVQEDVAKRWHEVTGCPIAQGYGLSETSPVVTMTPVTTDKFINAIGLPVPSTEVAIINEEGNQVPIGEDAEICIRGPQVMNEYWQRPEDTKAAFHPGGWFRSGDIGHMDENGFVHIADRKKDMILVSGFNVYPNEVEDILTQHQDIAEAAVIGIEDVEKGQIVRAYVVTNKPNVQRESIIEHCRKNLAAYKVPKQIEFREDLPKTNVGKVLRRLLKDEIQQNSAMTG